MSSLYQYLVSYIYTTSPENNLTHQPEPKPKQPEPESIKYLITINDLQKVNLKPVTNVIPNPTRNAPANFTKVDLRNLNKAQLNAILSVKLKPTPPPEKKVYITRHPVLRELLNKFNKKSDEIDDDFCAKFVYVIKQC